MSDPAFPSLACDCHFHVFSDAFPAVRGAVLHPPPASVDDYLRFAARAGVQRGVLVQPSVYGTDNRLLLQALAALGPRARGVAVMDDTVTAAQLRELHAAGVRGLRFNQVQVGATRMDMMRPLADRVAPLGWHIQLHMRADELEPHEALLGALPVPLVLDHGGRIAQATEGRQPDGTVVRRLVDRGNTWVKLSGPYIDAVDEVPPYRQAAAWGRDLVRQAPERLLWGSDWPHATERPKPALDGLLHHFWQCAGDAPTATRILVDNPSRLYGFDMDVPHSPAT